MPAQAGIHAFLKTTKKPNKTNYLKNQPKTKLPGTFHFYELNPFFGV